MLIQMLYINKSHEVIYNLLPYSVHKNTPVDEEYLGRLYITASRIYNLGFASRILDYDASTMIEWVTSII